MIPDVIDDAIENTEFTKRLEKVEVYTNWLEHKLLDIEILQMLEEEKKTGGGNSTQKNENIVLAIDTMLKRLTKTLYGFDFMSKEYMKQLKYAKQIALESKIKSLKLDSELETLICQKIQDNANTSDKYVSNTHSPEYFSERHEGLFKMQFRLLITTLQKVDGNEALIQNLLNCILKWEKDKEEKKRKADSYVSPVEMDVLQ